MIFLDTIVINGTFVNSYNQIISSPYFKRFMKEYLEKLEKKGNFPKILKTFKKKTYRYQELLSFIYTLTLKPIEDMDEVSRIELYDFVEGFYDFWREKHRFIVKRERFSKDINERNGILKSAIYLGDEFENTVRNLYRDLEFNISLKTQKVFRQLPSGAQVIFITDKMRAPVKKRMNYEWMYTVPFIWNSIIEPPAIFHTKSNKRTGVFPVVKSKFLDKVDLEGAGWYAIPIHVGKLLLYVYFNYKYLAHAAGLANLFDIGDPSDPQKPDGIVIFGLPIDQVGKEYKDGVIYEDEIYTGVIPDLDENDYFGYAKKMILTVHNLIMIDRGKLPIHGSLASIKLKNGKSANAMFVGDSGAGKSETLYALGNLDEVESVNILIDDMGSLSIEDDKVVAYGTEVGAFVRLDDLPPGYAYSTLDRSIFMNPDQTNARVIVPFDNYEEIITPIKIDFFLYANNYTAVDSDDERILFFKDVKSALEVFSAGARMAKGTTSEKGLSFSYFANPFGAVQRKSVHEKLAEKYVEKMFESGVKVGEIRTMLGVSGYEKEGTAMAAHALLESI
ncbi:MAG: hypothetical protein ACP5R1_05435 [Athalassotoga sp.]